uniref:Uncharacterized protein n=1 Tax=Knipowitschia caucasica TaxID=637954 RepID=A0AAV2L0Y4_KNICA
MHYRAPACITGPRRALIGLITTQQAVITDCGSLVTLLFSAGDVSAARYNAQLQGPTAWSSGCTGAPAAAARGPRLRLHRGHGCGRTVLGENQRLFHHGALGPQRSPLKASSISTKPATPTGTAPL